MNSRTYHSKMDWWVYLVFLLVGGLPLWSVGQGIRAGRPVLGEAALALMIVGFVVWLFVSTRYTLTDSELVVRAGPFRWRVPLRDVTSIRATRNPLSSPAWSWDRLRIEYGRQVLLISPREKAEFIRDFELRREALG